MFSCPHRPFSCFSAFLFTHHESEEEWVVELAHAVRREWAVHERHILVILHSSEILFYLTLLSPSVPLFPEINLSSLFLLVSLPDALYKKKSFYQW